MRLGPRLTVIHGPNGAGKTNLLEALYFGLHRPLVPHRERPRGRPLRPARRCAWRSTSRAPTATTSWPSGYEPAQPRRVTADGAPVERLLDVRLPPAGQRVPSRPPGAGQGRAGRPARATWTSSSRRSGRRAAPPGARTRRRSPSATRCSSRVRARRDARRRRSPPGTSSSDATRSRCATPARGPPTSWRRARRRSPPSSGSPGRPSCATARAAGATTAEAFAAELQERLDSDLARGFTGHGPHRDDLVLARDGRELRAYGSQGEQRMALLALLLAERDALAEARERPAAAAARRRDERARRRAPRAARGARHARRAGRS